MAETNLSLSKVVISVIIPTYNGEKKIVDLLQSLEHQTIKNFETIVVIDGSTDNTLQLLKETKWNLNALDIYYQENRGRGGARNSGFRRANGHFCVFLDDDVIAGNAIIEKYLNEYYNNKSIVVGSLKPFYIGTNKDFNDYCNYLNNNWNKKLTDGYLDIPYLTGNNFGIESKLFEKLNGFNENLSDIEDYELALRIRQQNIKIFYNSRIIAHHKLQEGFEEYINRKKEYYLLHKRVKKLYINEEIYTKKLANINPLKILIFHLLGSKIPRKIFLEGGFKVLPKFARYKIYNWMIDAIVFLDTKKTY